MDWRGLVTARWKYAFYETAKELLFDLEQDPYETNNLAETHPDVRRQMRLRLLDLLRELREPYFDVLIQHGVSCAADGVNVADEEYLILGLKA